MRIEVLGGRETLDHRAARSRLARAANGLKTTTFWKILSLWRRIVSAARDYWCIDTAYGGDGSCEVNRAARRSSWGVLSDLSRGRGWNRGFSHLGLRARRFDR